MTPYKNPTRPTPYTSWIYILCAQFIAVGYFALLYQAFRGQWFQLELYKIFLNFKGNEEIFKNLKLQIINCFNRPTTKN
jgi:hypothetical protein